MTAKYDKIGSDYDTTRRADRVLLDRLASLLRIRKGASYLDLACGSGNYTSAMAKLGGEWFGIDQSTVMLTKAMIKSSDVVWVEGSVDGLPFEDDFFEGITCTLAIHHFPSLVKAFREARRVLRNGRFVLFTSTAEQMRGYWLQEYFPDAMERSWNQMPEMDSIGKALTSSGFKIVAVDPYFVREDLEDLFLYSGKHRPEMYLDPNVRRGISTFSSLANPDEIAAGCKKLRIDIESEKIKEVIQNYENDLGDYCFVVAGNAT